MKPTVVDEMKLPVHLVAHRNFSPPVVVASESLFLVGLGLALGAYWVSHHRTGMLGRASTIALGATAAACLIAATTLPFFVGPGSLSRPASTASLAMVSPLAGEVFHGHPADVPVEVALSGGRIVPFSTIHIVPDEGHIHLYLDDRLVAMTAGLRGVIVADPGTHTLRVEFVAADHGPFRPAVTAEVSFSVRA